MIILWVISFFTGVIAVRLRIESAKEISGIQDENFTALFRVQSFPEIQENFTSFEAGLYFKQNTKILVKTGILNDITFGQCIIARLSCKEITDYGVPGVASFKTRQLVKSIRYSCNVSSQQVISGIKNCDYFFVPYINRIRNFIRNFIKTNFSSTVANFLIAITIGEKNGMDEQTIKNFRSSGTAHLLAISGLHVGIVGAFVFFLFRNILKIHYKIPLYFNIRKISAFLAIPCILVFSAIAGMSPSTQRAFIMSTILLLSIVLMHKPDLFYITSVAWCIMLIIDPSSIFDISFQLSFAAVGSIILSFRRINPENFIKVKNVILNKIIIYFLSGLITTVAGFAGTAGIIAQTFKTISLIFIPANMIAVPLTTIILPLLLVNICLCWVPYLSDFLIQSIEILTGFLINFVGFTGSYKYASISVPPPDNIQFTMYYILLVFLLIKISLQHKMIIVAGCITILLIYTFRPVHNNHELIVSFIDVGQGDATLIEFPEGKKMLVDCGPAFPGFNAGENIIAPFLWKKRIKKIDVLVMTHQQNDHVGGCTYIIKKFNVNEIWIPDTNWNKDNIKNYPSRLIKLLSGKIINFGEVKISSHNPGINQSSDENNNSIVLKIKYKKFSLLLTGDIEKKAESILTGDLNSKVLKVSHHGSCTSSSEHFLFSVQPEFAIISSGRSKLLHHPCPKTLKTIKKFNPKTFITAVDGSIFITSDGERICVNTYYNPELVCEKL